jgi:hypothetical protein
MTMSGDGDNDLEESLIKSNSNNSVGSIYFNLCGLAIAWALTLTTSTLLTTIGENNNKVTLNFTLIRPL